MTENDLANVANSSPENLIFFSNAELLEDYDDQPKFARIAILAELLVRGFFNPASEEICNCISRHLPSESFEQYNSWRANASPIQKPSQLFLVPLNEKLSQTEFLQNVQIKAQHRFEALLGRCDGIVPIIRTESNGEKRGCAIPFYLEKADGSESCVIDIKGNPIPEWSKAVAELNLPDVCVRLLFDSSIENMSYNGFSLQLPVLMAYWRQNNQLPKYNPFAIIATGKIQDNRLASVCLEQKYEGLSERFDKPVFIYPDGDDPADSKANDKNKFPIPVGTPVKEVLSKCEQYIVKNGLAKFGIQYIVKRLGEISQSVKKDKQSTWDFIIEHLQLFLKELDEDQYPMQYLHALLALSFAYCHSANTAKAHDYNREAIKFANNAKNLYGLDLQYELLLLSIEEMVILQDEENFEEIPMLASEIENQLNQLDPDKPETFDLKMRYYGTLGQTHMCGAVCKMDGFDQEKARECISKAIFNAEQYNNRTPEDNIDEVIRDKNYRHLWYALFEPDTPKERKLYEEIVRETNENQSPGQPKDTNLNFQFRQRCLAVYRRILKSGDATVDSLADELIPAPANIFDWLQALIYKYQAAMLAFQRRNADAKKLFDKSYDILSKNDYSSLFQFMTMSVAAEAYRSFSELGDEKTAKEYRQKALDLFSSNNDFQNFKTAQPWKDFLNTPWDEFKASGKEFPGLHYYY